MRLSCHLANFNVIINVGDKGNKLTALAIKEIKKKEVNQGF